MDTQDEDEIDHRSTTQITCTINNLPDDVLENLFLRLSPYQDLEAVSIVSRKWNRLSRATIQQLQTQFKQSIVTGRLLCSVYPGNVGYSDPYPWPQGRFAQMPCYYDKALYVIGGSTDRKTTFNDMWQYALGPRTWTRIISRGKYPSPKAFATCVRHKDDLYLFGGWSYTSNSPLVTPWRLFDELHRYNFDNNTWTYIVGSSSPPPTAGHSCSVFGDEMVIFGGRTYDLANQRYPVSNDVWLFDFNAQDWYHVVTETGNLNRTPVPRYGQTQVALDESHIVIIGGCDGPTKIFHDVWLLSLATSEANRTTGSWRQLTVTNQQGIPRSPFHYSGCRVGDSVVFFQQTSSISPYTTFLHFDGSQLPAIYQQMAFEDMRETNNLRRPLQDSSPTLDRWRLATCSPPMSMYSLDISKVLVDQTVKWTTEGIPTRTRPRERFLHAVVAGRGELIFFGGYFKQPAGRRYRVASDIFILRTVPETY